MPSETKSCILTGANGYVGSQLRRHLERAGWRVIAWTRRPEAGSGGVTFRLGQEVQPDRLKEAQALVHCAYDFGPRKWEEIAAVNVSGSRKLLEAARQGGLASVVFISSLSAFAGCRSLYGKAKLEIEDCAQTTGAVILRPGLVYGDDAGGMFGRLVGQVRKSRWLPILRGGKQRQYLVHEEDVGNLVLGCLSGRVPGPQGPITVAHDQGWELKDILAHIAHALDKPVSFVPVPWQMVWAALKALELAGARPNFRSDSLISMVYQDPSPSFALLKTLGFQCRPFQWRPLA